MMTIAEQIAEQFDNNGLCFETEDGAMFEDVCSDKSVNRVRRGADTSYEFEDDSVLTVVGGAWDVGCMLCWGWVLADHDHDCAADEYARQRQH